MLAGAFHMVQFGTYAPRTELLTKLTTAFILKPQANADISLKIQTDR